MPSRTDIDTLRELASRVAEIAALPAQEEKRQLWRQLNALKPERPMVMIDQVCWNEMGRDGELALQCEDRECRGYKGYLRRTLYQWDAFPVDMVVEPFVRVHCLLRARETIRMVLDRNGCGWRVAENALPLSTTHSE